MDNFRVRTWIVGRLFRESPSDLQKRAELDHLATLARVNLSRARLGKHRHALGRAMYSMARYRWRLTPDLPTARALVALGTTLGLWLVIILVLLHTIAT